MIKRTMWEIDDLLQDIDTLQEELRALWYLELLDMEIFMFGIYAMLVWVRQGGLRRMFSRRVAAIDLLFIAYLPHVGNYIAKNLPSG